MKSSINVMTTPGDFDKLEQEFQVLDETNANREESSKDQSSSLSSSDSDSDSIADCPQDETIGA